MGRGIFALDIGTRTVVGLVMDQADGDYTILAQEVIEHASRVMYDGQIHDIEAVAESVRKIKQKLEEDLGYEIKEASVAAAGRALHTVAATGKKKVSPFVEITKEDIQNIEAKALSLAGKSLECQGEGVAFEDYYLVGYNPVRYQLDDVALTSLLGQRGKTIKVELVATFLPRTVVDSLMAVLARCDLSLKSITLEPIAAGSIVISPEIRKLNIALVDIGAGTSDIAISTDGSIFAYGMVPWAGDEITEKICEEYLLDFHEGEELKRQLGGREQVVFQDILGSTHKKNSRDVLKAIRPYIQDLAGKIAEKILELNGKTPAAVILIGGGSQLVGLGAILADHLGLPDARVGVRGREGLAITGGEGLKGPFSITPIGIGMNSLEEMTLSFIQVQVEGKTLHLLGQEKPTILDGLMQAGISSAKIFGRPGPALTFTLNGELMVVPGGKGTPGQAVLDGEVVPLDTPIFHQAKIDFIPGKEGPIGQAKIKDFISPGQGGTIKINGRDFPVDPLIQINGSPGTPEDKIPDKAQIRLYPKDLILSDIFNIISFEPKATGGTLITNVNGKQAGFATPIKLGDSIEIYWQN